LLAIAATPAPVPLDPLRCLMVSGVIAQNSDANIAQMGKFASLYWMGRVNGATPNANLSEQLAARAKAMEGVNLQAEAQRCGEEMKKRGEEMQAAGQALQARAAKQPPAK
jgi:hypothetical protein